MCGIFGANKLERFLTLYELNKKRGTFSTSAVISTREGDLVVHRWSGSVDTDKLKAELINSVKITKQTPAYYLGHTQAPTSSSRKWVKECSHPFHLDGWTIAHNGVLTNYDAIKEQFNPKWKNPVDSSGIPLLLSETTKLYSKTDGVHEVISKALSLLEGTFGLWIHEGWDRNIYLARCGSTLFANLIDNEFSSVKFKNSEELKEGVLYMITVEGITAVSSFDFNSPFFT